MQIAKGRAWWEGLSGFPGCTINLGFLFSRQRGVRLPSSGLYPCSPTPEEEPRTRKPAFPNALKRKGCGGQGFPRSPPFILSKVEEDLRCRSGALL